MLKCSIILCMLAVATSENTLHFIRIHMYCTEKKSCYFSAMYEVNEEC